MKLSSIFIFLTYLTLFSNSIYSQSSLGVTAYSNKDKSPLAYVTIALFKADSLLANGGITDANGKFVLDNLMAGNYILVSSIVGYITDSTNVEVGNNKNVQIEIVLKEDVVMLSNVEVSEMRNPIKHRANGLSVDIANYTSTDEKNALDVIHVLPGVIGDGAKLSVMGKGAVIQINGRILSLSGKQLEAYLNSIQGNSIKSIELITSPPARYDAEFSGSIIDIKLKNMETEGVNGQASMAVSLKETGWVYEPSLSLNYRKNKISMYGNYGAVTGKFKKEVHQSRRYSGTPPIFYDDRENKKQSGISNNIMFGLDYFMSDKHTLGLVVNANDYDGDDDSDINTLIKANTLESIQDSSIRSILDRSSKNQYMSANINYKWITDTFGSFLNTDFTYSQTNSDGEQTMKSDYYDSQNVILHPSDGFGQTVNQKTNIITIRTDYVKNIKKSITLETGMKASFVRRGNRQDYSLFSQKVWVTDSIQNNILDYYENIFAAYVSLDKKWERWSVSAGLRGEQTYYKGRQTNNGIAFKNNYFNLFPSLYIARNLTNRGSLSGSYTYKITRPSFYALNPFRFYNGYRIYQEGNPDLGPYFSHSFDMKYNSSKGCSVSLSHTMSEDEIVQEPYQDDQTGEVIYTYKNFGSTKSTVLVLYVPYSPFKWWSMRFTGIGRFVEYSSLFMDRDYSTNDISGNFSLLNSFKLMKDLGGEVYVRYNTVRKSVVTDIDDRLYMHFTLKKKLFQDRGILAVSYLNPFRLYDFSSSIQNGNMDLHTSETADRTMVKVSFSYNFGSNKIKRYRRRDTGAEDVVGRAR
ncbi:MAG: outer membrane beta-barrel protein [Bacteroidales bacterium]